MFSEMKLKTELDHMSSAPGFATHLYATLSELFMIVRAKIIWSWEEEEVLTT